jgi:hypothetical protein
MSGTRDSLLHNPIRALSISYALSPSAYLHIHCLEAFTSRSSNYNEHLNYNALGARAGI